MSGRNKIKSSGSLMSSEITTESGEPIPRVTDYKIEIRDHRVYAILTICDPILEIEAENYEVK